jgi:hypothetical protein
MINLIVQIVCILLLTGTAHCIDNPHFYRATYFWQEPRLEKDWLTTVDILFGGGKTKSSRNENGTKTTLLNLYGPHNMQALGVNVPGLNPADPLDQILIDLQNLPLRDNFGQLQFHGKFTLLETVFNVYQNLVNGFFVQAYLPIRKLRISDIGFVDLSPDDTITPNKNTPAWQSFLNNIDLILNQHNLHITPIDTLGFGDVTILGGWTQNINDTLVLDYVDVTGKIGVLFPTGKKKHLSNPFDLPTGYNGHFAVPLKFDISCGALEWVTLGGHIGALFFFKRNEYVELKTAEAQNGFIKLAQGSADVEPGNIWDFSIYMKADHFLKGLSLIVGYNFTAQDRTCIEPKDPIFNPVIINNDNQFRNWRMQTLQLCAEYDFAKTAADIGPRVGLLVNYIVGGKRIFNTATTSTYIGFDIEWCF